MEQDGALVDAVVDILWKAALPLARQTQKHQTNNPEKKQVIVTLVGHDPCFQTKGNFIGDGFTEKVIAQFIGILTCINILVFAKREQLHASM